jgi:TPP-dependent pyruvate/acetoin dehydrogenase alpha subunit
MTRGVELRISIYVGKSTENRLNSILQVVTWVSYNFVHMSDNLSLYRTMLLIRRFEERLLNEFSSGRLVGTTHAYIGQEANAAGIFSELSAEDVLFSNHRCHGHFLAYGGDPYLLAAELMGKVTGLVGGRGGSQHIHWRNFYSNGIQGGIVPVATGMALAEKIRKSGSIVIVFLGDGTLGEGVVYESLNIASLWSLPVLYVVENNRYAQTTPIYQAVSGSIKARFSAFGMDTWELDTSDVTEIGQAAQEATGYVRNSSRPAGLVLNTNRFAAHSKGDDVRDPQEVAGYKQKDPLTIHGRRISTVDLKRAESDVASIIDDAFKRAAADPFPELKGSSRS